MWKPHPLWLTHTTLRGFVQDRRPIRLHRVRAQRRWGYSVTGDRLPQAIPPSNRYPTVLSRLQSDSDLSQFVQALPPDVRSVLDQRNSNTWYTVFAPTNRAWNEAVSRLPPGESVANLARHHVLNKMLCSRAITRESSEVGPTMAEDYVRMTRTPNGRPAVLGPCSDQIPFERPDLMSATGVIHVVDKAITPLGSMELDEALKCLQRGGKQELAQAAREMEECDVVSRSKAKVVLLPTAKALQGAGDNPSMAKRMRSDRAYRCKVYAHHLLTPDNPKSLKNTKQNGFVQEEKFRTDYTAPNGSPVFVTGSYVRERDGSKLSFNGAKTTNLKPLKFRNGLIYSVESVNYPPEKTMLELIREEPNTIQIVSKIQETGIQKDFDHLESKVLFLAPIDMGWKTRDVENAYSTPQTRKLLQLHTIPHPIFGGDNGFVWHSTIHKVDTLLPDRSGGRIQLTIKRHPDGNTFIGHSELPEKLWAMVLKWNKVGTDGVVWMIDWPIRCPEDIC
ncbi:Gynecophoral canal protein [Fasciola gigantica]|uniref:Gynecophoral canal protein n=1 Tax=Fasciola gigantica TaxID=46835 RepID=A0A504Z8C5_FASGI|nr:Gynecophoral canal protein [Fasciola gigantica]